MDNAIKGYLFTFTVVGKGKFPVDMLRYDECYPRTGDDAAKIVPQYLGQDSRVQGSASSREVVLSTVQVRKRWEPTVDRWRSFGWSVVPTLRGNLDEPVSYVEEAR